MLLIFLFAFSSSMALWAVFFVVVFLALILIFKKHYIYILFILTTDVLVCFESCMLGSYFTPLTCLTLAPVLATNQFPRNSEETRVGIMNVD